MPEDLRNKILQAIAESDNDEYRAMLLLLMQAADAVEALAEQMTVPAQQHADDHRWISDARVSQGNVKTIVWRVAGAVVEKGTLVAIGAMGFRLFGS